MATGAEFGRDVITRDHAKSREIDAVLSIKMAAWQTIAATVGNVAGGTGRGGVRDCGVGLRNHDNDNVHVPYLYRGSINTLRPKARIYVNTSAER